MHARRPQQSLKTSNHEKQTIFEKKRRNAAYKMEGILQRNVIWVHPMCDAITLF